MEVDSYRSSWPFVPPPRDPPRTFIVMSEPLYFFIGRDSRSYLLMSTLRAACRDIFIRAQDLSLTTVISQGKVRQVINHQI